MLFISVFLLFLTFDSTFSNSCTEYTFHTLNPTNFKNETFPNDGQAIKEYSIARARCYNYHGQKLPKCDTKMLPSWLNIAGCGVQFVGSKNVTLPWSFGKGFNWFLIRNPCHMSRLYSDSWYLVFDYKVQFRKWRYLDQQIICGLEKQLATKNVGVPNKNFDATQDSVHQDGGVPAQTNQVSKVPDFNFQESKASHDAGSWFLFPNGILSYVWIVAFCMASFFAGLVFGRTQKAVVKGPVKHVLLKGDD